MSCHHQVAYEYLSAVASTINKDDTGLDEVLDVTGPPALTAAAQRFACRAEPNLSWDALSALDEQPAGGRGKVVGDMLVLPITGFSPGRGRFQNMGSHGRSK